MSRNKSSICYSEQNTSDFTIVSNGNSTEYSAPLVYANLETVNSVYLAQTPLNYKSSYILPAANIYEEEGEEEDDEETTEIEKETLAPNPNPPNKKRGRPLLITDNKDRSNR